MSHLEDDHKWWENHCSPDVLKEAAKQETKLTDFGDSYFEEGLERLVASLREDARLHNRGKQFMCRWLMLRLKTRLYMQQSLVEHREAIDRARPDQPMFVTGFPRTGTTLLYGLLACDPKAHAPLLWETFDPAPPPAKSPPQAIAKRICECQKLLNDAPDASKIHYFGCATAIEECHPLLAPSFRIPVVVAMAHVRAYTNWLYGLRMEDILPAYQCYADGLAMLRCGYEEKRWLSKSPLHCWFMSALLHVFPKAYVVHMHRKPSKAIPSMCNLYQFHRSRRTDDRRPNETGRLIVGLYRLYLERFEKVRHSDNIFDVDYEELVSDPAAKVRDVHQHFDIPLWNDYKSTIREWLREHPHVPYSYDADEFGLNKKLLNRLDEYYAECLKSGDRLPAINYLSNHGAL